MNNLDIIYEKVAKELNINSNRVKEVYNAYWKTIKQHIESLPLKTIDIDKFNELQPNINIYHLGKLYITYDRFKKLRNKYENNKSKEDKTNV